MLSSSRLLAGLSLAWLAAPELALAHIGQGDIQGGLLAGLSHPLFGVDHVLAFVAVGLWATQLGGRAKWLLPVTFPLVMALGGMLGAMQLPLSGIEIGIAVSVVALGSLVTFAVRPALRLAATLAAVFALFHGYAHGAELPSSANAIAYAGGFVMTTGALHALGLVIGAVNRWRNGGRVVRAAGSAIALGGFYFLVGA